MKKKHILYTISGIMLLLIAVSCPGCKGVQSAIQSGIASITETVVSLSAREKYLKELKEEPLMATQWEGAYNAAVQDSLGVSLPYGEKGAFIPHVSPAYSYVVAMREGEVLKATIASDSLNQRMFITVLESTSTGYEVVKTNEGGENMLSCDISESGIYKVIVQPELAANTPFFLSLEKNPLYGFPVAGKGNSDVGSFWGMDRDGGKRRHEGIDIFAKRGTPVVAITDGFISYTGEKGLGGKQVWLRDGLLGRHLYYAHLDSIKTTSGSRVKLGDTLGFVGNTGNARTTVPHLHFGIYKGGAVDPLPFVYKMPKATASSFQQLFKTEVLITKSAANLRQSPDTKSTVLGKLPANENVLLLGQSDDWLHIQVKNGMKAFLHKSLAKPNAKS